jgi:hypothetical protein
MTFNPQRRDMEAVKNIGSITMPAGEYFVGDPCYSVPGERWMEWLNAADYENEDRYLLAELDGRPVLGIGTAFGDGEFPGSNGERYPVDAGLIGLVPCKLSKEEDPFGAHRETFDRSFECSYDDGKIHLGHITIDTENDEYDPDAY